MFTNIIITYTSSNIITDTTLKIGIDGNSINYQLNNNTILISDNITFGLHKLTIEPANEIDNEFKIQFTDVNIAGSELRHSLYLSYCLKNSQQQNTTVLNEYHPNWNLPFGNPVSWWLGECADNIPNGIYGKNLADTMEIFYPESIIIKDTYPPLIQDFFKYNFGFHTYNKDTSLTDDPKVPYLKLNLEYDEQALYDEFNKNIDILANQNYVPPQIKYNQHENPTIPPWLITMAVPLVDKKTTDITNIDNRIAINKTDFPIYYELISSIQGIEVGLSFIGTLYPGSYVAPHVDDYALYVEGFEKSVQIFIPVGWKPGNYFKFGKVGLIPYNNGAYLTRAASYHHCSVNQSDTVRFTIGIMCKIVGNEFNQYLA